MAEGVDGIQTRAVAVTMLNKPSRLTRGGPLIWCVGGRTNNSSAQSNQRVTKFHIGYWTWADTLCDQLQDIAIGRACGTHGTVGKYIRPSVENPEGKGSFGRARYRKEGNITMDVHVLGRKDTLLSLGSSGGLL